MIEINSTNATRASLLGRVIERDQIAWEQFVDLYGPLVAYWCRERQMDAATVADIVQDVFLSVSISIGRFRSLPGAGAFRSWLWKITRSKVIDTLRRQSGIVQAEGGTVNLRTMNDLSDPNSLPDDDPTDQQALSELTSRALEQIRDEFESRTWLAFWRSTVDGVSSDVVAKELGISPAGVRQSRSRILRRLRQFLNEPIE